ncbi:MAG: hypothetical protein Q7S36_00050 [Candidatus Liptonbacteria bacterium]|nr:hypothetical protein [Candidatus Liptonbacteria bacterium]
MRKNRLFTGFLLVVALVFGFFVWRVQVLKRSLEEFDRQITKIEKRIDKLKQVEEQMERDVKERSR